MAVITNNRAETVAVCITVGVGSIVHIANGVSVYCRTRCGNIVQDLVAICPEILHVQIAVCHGIFDFIN